MINLIYNVFGFTMLIWYTCIRWAWLGTELGKIIDGVFKLNWWFAPINMFTAFTSFIFIIPTLFFFNETHTRFWASVGLFLLIRNIFYTIEDVIDYKKNPSTEQLIFIIIDVIMWVYCLIYLYKIKSFI